MFAAWITRVLPMSSALGAGMVLAVLTLAAQSPPAEVSLRIEANSNRTPAGKLENGVLTLRLEMRQADWYPEADTGPRMTVYAFGEEGKALQVPSPLIRVPQGTEIRITLHNFLPATAMVHGLHSHPGEVSDVVQVPAEKFAKCASQRERQERINIGQVPGEN
jgi:FtsP/CotA-like multicopper oxidase with cupredoxin domain